MPFFIKGKRKNRLREGDEKNADSTESNHRRKPEKRKKRKRDCDEEIDSDLEEDEEDDPRLENEYKYSSESEAEETVQEKRLRLARTYLEEIRKEEKKRLEVEEVDRDVLGQRLKEDVLEKAGRLRKRVADSYSRCGDATILRCKEHSRSITCLVVSSDSKYLFSASDDFNIVKWSIESGTKVSAVKRTHDKGHKKKILTLALSCDNRFLASAGCEAKINVWDPGNLTHLHTFTGHKVDVTGLAFRKNTHQLFSCSSDKSVKLWNLDDMAYVETLYGHSSGITSVDALARDRAVTSGGRDNTLRIWKVPEESHLVLNGFKESIDCVKLLNENNCVSGSDNGNICLWSNLKKKPAFTLEEAHGTDPASRTPNWILSLAAYAHTDMFASGSSNGTINLYRCDEKFKSFEKCMETGVDGYVNCMAFTQDGRYLVAGVGQEHRIGRWHSRKSVKNSILLIPLVKKST